MSEQEGRNPPRAFISFSRQDGDDHIENVRRFVDLLRRQGVDVHWDGDVSRGVDWSTWMTRQANESGYVLLIASPTYKHYADADEPDGGGRGVVWEARWIRRRLYEDGAAGFLNRVLVVVLPDRSVFELPEWTPPMLRPYEVAELTPSGIEDILRHVHNRPYGRPEPGPEPYLPTWAEEQAQHELVRSQARSAQQQIAEEFGRALSTFRGRESALSRIRDWLSAPSDRRSIFVTSGPGSGKTALLGLEAYLGGGFYYRVSESPIPADLRPPRDSIDVALHVHNMFPAAIIAAIARAADMPEQAIASFTTTVPLAEAASALVSHVRKQGTQLTVLLDALDQLPQLTGADDPATPSDPDDIYTVLLRPLAADPQAPIRFLLGGRPQTLAKAGFGPLELDERVIDLDGEHQDTKALRDRAEAVLLGQDSADQDLGAKQDGAWQATRLSSPWQEARRADVETVLSEIVAIAGRSFYIAEAIARGQARLSQLPDLTGTEWKKALPKDVGPAMRAELDQRLGTPEQARRALQLLLPLAYGRGDGIPWDSAWLPLANALCPGGSPSFSEQDLEWIRTHASSYVVPGVSSRTGGPVFRLYHETLAAYLTGSEWPGSGARNRQEDEQAIVACLLLRVPLTGGRRDWTRASQYTSAHLLEHAVAGDSLADIDELAFDPGFLANGPDAELRDLLARLTEPRHRAVADVHRAVLVAMPARLSTAAGDAAAGRKSTDEVRGFLAQLSLAARCRDVEALASRIEVGDEPNQAPWQATWAAWRRQPPYVRLAGHVGRIRAATTVTSPDRGVLVMTGDDDGELRFWDVSRGALTQAIPHAHVGAVLGLAAGLLAADGPIAISTGQDQLARAWSLSRGTAVELAQFREHKSPVHAVTLVDLPSRGPTAISGDDHGTVWFWNPSTGKATRPPYHPSEHGITALAVAQLHDEPHVVSAHTNGEVLVWKPGVPEPRITARWPEGRMVRALTVVRNRRPIVVFAGDDGIIHKWDPGIPPMPAGTATDDILARHSRGVWALGIAELSDGTPVVISGGTDGRVRVWRLADGTSIGGPFTGHDAPVRALTVAAAAGNRSIVVSAGDDRVPMAWDLTVSGTVNEPFAGHQQRVRSLLFTQVNEAERLISGGSDGTIRQWDPETGTQIGAALAGQRHYVSALAALRIGSRRCIVSGGGDAQVLIRDAETGESVTPPVKQPPPVTALIALPVGDGSRIAAASYIGQVGVWDPETDQPPVSYIGCDIPGKPVYALGTVRIDPSRPDLVIVSGGEGGGLHLWNPATPAVTDTTVVASGHKMVTAIAAIPSRPSCVVTGGDDGVVRIQDLADPRAQSTEWGRHEGSRVHALAVVDDGDQLMIASAHADGTVRFSDGTPGPAATFIRFHGGHAWALAAGTLGSRRVMFSAGDDHVIKAWDVDRRSPLRRLPSGWVRAVATCPYPAAHPMAGQWMVVSAGEDDTIQVRDLDWGETRHEIVRPARHRGVRALAITETDPPVVVSGGVDHRLRLWDPVTVALQGQLRGHGDWIRAIAATSVPGFDAVAVSASGDGHVGIWDIDGQTAIGAPRDLRAGGIRAVAVSDANAEHDRLLVCGAGNVILVSSLSTGEPVGDEFTFHRAPVRALVIVAMGDRTAVISGDEDGVVLAWDLVTRELISGAPPCAEGQINAVAAHQRGYRGGGCTWAAVAAGDAVTLSSWSVRGGWDERMTARFGSQVLAVAMPRESWDDEPPGRLAVGATQGVAVLLVGGRQPT